MKYKDPVTGELKSIIVKSGDTLPIGTIIEFDGTEIPDGYEEVSYEETGSMGNIIVDDISCKNIFDGILKVGTIDGTNGSEGGSTNRVRSANFMKVKPNTAYTLSSETIGAKGFIFEYQENGTFIQRIPSSFTTLPYTFTPSANTYKIKFILSKSDDSTITINDIAKVQLEKGSVATDYVEHKEFESGIVESGNNSNGSYIKFADGTMICYGKITKTLIANMQLGPLYYADNTDVNTFPQAFISTPCITMSAETNSGGYGHFVYAINSTKNAITKYTVIRPASTISASYITSYTAIGRWK